MQHAVARPSRIAGALGLAVAGILALVAPVAAECLELPPPTTVAGYVGYGFTAHVIEADQISRPNHPPLWDVVLKVRQVYRGNVPPTIEITGYPAEITCQHFHGDLLRVGDEIAVTTDHLRGRGLGDHVLAWRKADIGWMWDNHLIRAHDGGIDRFIPAAARDARDTSEIVAIMRGGLPDTAMATVELPADPLVLSLIPGVALAVGFRRRQRRRYGSMTPSASER